MIKLTVIENDGEDLAYKISRQTARNNGIAVSRVYAASDAPDADILVVSPSCVPLPRDERKKPRCKVLLLPGGVGAGFADPKSVVTYGMNSKNTLTLSSIGQENCVLALQRELVTASGGVVDRQEFKVRSSGGADDLLAVSGALLLLDMPLS